MIHVCAQMQDLTKPRPGCHYRGSLFKVDDHKVRDAIPCQPALLGHKRMDDPDSIHRMSLCTPALVFRFIFGVGTLAADHRNQAAADIRQILYMTT